MINRLLVVLAATSIAVAGCVFPNFGSSFGGFDNDDMPFPTVLATYTQGSATLDISQSGTDTAVTLERVGPGSRLMSMPGGGVSWRNDVGWVLQLDIYDYGFAMPRASGAPAAPQSYSGEVTIQRIHDHQFWRAGAYDLAGNRCIVDITTATPTSLTGSATCRGLRWVDGTVPQGLMEPVYIEGEEPFDTEIAFEARP